MEAIPGQTVHNPVPFTLPSELDVPVRTLIQSLIWRYFLYSRKADPRHDKDTRQQRRFQRVKALARLLSESLLLGLCAVSMSFFCFSSTLYVMCGCCIRSTRSPYELRLIVLCAQEASLSSTLSLLFRWHFFNHSTQLMTPACVLDCASYITCTTWRMGE